MSARSLSQAHYSLNELDRFTSGIDGWQNYESATVKQGDESYIMEQSKEHAGSLHIDGSHITNSLGFTAGAVKQFTNPLGTSCAELYFDFRTKIKDKHPVRLNTLFVAVFNSRTIIPDNLIFTETLFNGNLDGRQQRNNASGLDSGWHTQTINLSAITDPYLSVLFYVQNFESYDVGKQFWLDNIFLLREPIENESSYSLPDGDISKGIPQDRISGYEKIVGRPYAGRVNDNRSGNNGRG